MKYKLQYALGFIIAGCCGYFAGEIIKYPSPSRIMDILMLLAITAVFAINLKYPRTPKQ